MSMHNQTSIQLHLCNVDRVYDLTVVHPGVKLNCTHSHSLLVKRNAAVVV